MIPVPRVSDGNRHDTDQPRLGALKVMRSYRRPMSACRSSRLCSAIFSTTVPENSRPRPQRPSVRLLAVGTIANSTRGRLIDSSKPSRRMFSISTPS